MAQKACSKGIKIRQFLPAPQRRNSSQFIFNAYDVPPSFDFIVSFTGEGKNFAGEYCLWRKMLCLEIL
jgi:hypothetical protein